MTEREQNPSTKVDAPKLDVLVVLGKNIGIGWKRDRIATQRSNLSVHSRVSVLAAGILYDAKVANKILFSTGKTAGENVPSEAEAMRRQLKRVFPHIPDEAIVLEEVSTQTKENAQEVAKIAEKENYRNLGLLTVGFHMRRAKMLFEREGLSTTGFSSEDVVASIRPGKMRRYKWLAPLVYIERGKEALALIIQSVPALEARFEKKVKDERSKS